MAATDSRDDETLTAFIDGALDQGRHRDVLARLGSDAAFKARLDRLQGATQGLPEAMAALGRSAPRDTLDAMLDDALAAVRARPPTREPPVARRASWLTPLRALAAMIAIAILAGGIGYGLGGARPKPPEGWREAVAEYWRLTTAETLAIEPPPALADRQLAQAGAALGLALTPASVALNGPSFRGAQLYAFQGKPLAQIAFLDADHGPIAYCIIRNGSAESFGPTTVEIDGFNVVHWQDGGVGRMLIGHAPAARLEQLAGQLKARSGEGA